MFVNSPSLSFTLFLCEEALDAAKERITAGISGVNDERKQRFDGGALQSPAPRKVRNWPSPIRATR
jgi:hypothetical protein